MAITVTACGSVETTPNNQGSGTSSSSGGGGGGGGGSGGACHTIAPPPGAELPRVSATGANATAIAKALDEIFATQTPPVSPGETYAIASLDCSHISVPSGESVGCAMKVSIDGGEPVDVSTNEASSALAQELLGAFSAAGSECSDPHGERVSVEDMTVSPDAVQYDDKTSLDVIPAPDVVVQGMAAQDVINAMAAAGIDDCDPTHKVFLICNNLGAGAPDCGFQWTPVQKVGSSELRPVCGPSSTAQGAGLTAEASLALWQSILAAADKGGYQPANGTLEQTTVINARYFSWDGSNLGFTLVADSVTPPPAPGG